MYQFTFPSTVQKYSLFSTSLPALIISSHFEKCLFRSSAHFFDSKKCGHSKGDQLWVFLGRNDAKAETPVLWPPHGKSWLIGKDSDAGRDCGQEEKGVRDDEMAGCHHWLDGRESEWTQEVSDEQGGLACCDLWKSVTKCQRRVNDWIELNNFIHVIY